MVEALIIAILAYVLTVGIFIFYILKQAESYQVERSELLNRIQHPNYFIPSSQMSDSSVPSEPFINEANYVGSTYADVPRAPVVEVEDEA